MTADQIIQSLNLKPHPEGGYYQETYRGPLPIPGFKPQRVFSTAIYYLLVPGSVSKMHRITSDEIFHFYLGDPVTWVLLGPNGVIQKIILGKGLEQGQQVQLVVPAGTWFGGYLNEGGSFALMGTTVAPGFEFEDFVLGAREKLLALFSHAADEIQRLT
jgi:predicted cupin superfamily sugar epimerase